MENKYNKIIDKHKSKEPVLENTLKSFLVGGIIAVIGQGLIYLYNDVLNISESLSVSLMITTLILVSTILTGLGKYDIIGQFSGAGSIVPITGFANTMTSAAMESKNEGLIIGIATNIFKLAGCVIVIGVVSAYVFGSIRYFLEVIL